MFKALSYDDVLLVPKHSDIASRDEIDIGCSLDENIHLSLPIISSPMDTVTESAMAATMALKGGLGIIHRYSTVEQQAAVVRSAVNKLIDAGVSAPVGAAIGATGDFLWRVTELVESGAELICIDVAHGDHIFTERALKTIRDKYGELVHLMAGNVATVEGYNNLDAWGADSVRCGIGGGSICSTRIETGHGVPTFQTVLECASTPGPAIVADGGLKNSGDIVKALAAGADCVIVGSILAGTDQTPGSVSMVDGEQYKSYRGMASAEAQRDWRGDSNYSEGVATMVPYKGCAESVLRKLKQGIASGFSYSGARSIQELWDKAEFVLQTPAGQRESSTHILSR